MKVTVFKAPAMEIHAEFDDVVNFKENPNSFTVETKNNKLIYSKPEFYYLCTGIDKGAEI